MPSVVASKTARADITEQFFTAGELMERVGELDDFDLDGGAASARSPAVHGWLALAAASAVGLLVLVILTF